MKEKPTTTDGSPRTTSNLGEPIDANQGANSAPPQNIYEKALERARMIRDKYSMDNNNMDNFTPESA